MKRKFLLLIIITIFVLTGCGNKNTKNVANNSVGDLNFFVPTNYEYREELKGLAYTENEKKVFVKGIFDDFNDAIFINVYTIKSDDSLKKYIETLSSGDDVEFSLNSNNNISDIYSRENYFGKQHGVDIVLYMYICKKDNYIYMVNISGPKTKNDEVSNTAYDVYSSLTFN